MGERITQISNTIMTQRGAVIVFSKGASLANADSIDITNEVLAALNQQLPAVSVTPLASLGLGLVDRLSVLAAAAAGVAPTRHASAMSSAEVARSAFVNGGGAYERAGRSA